MSCWFCGVVNNKICILENITEIVINVFKMKFLLVNLLR